MSLLKFNPDLLTLEQQAQVYKISEDIIRDLDEYAINDLFSGTEKDIDSMLDNILLETRNCLFTNKGPIKTSSFGYLDKLTENFDRELKKKSLNYFIITVLPEFQMNTHHIEWGNLIQFYPKLCVIAARDHSKSFTFSYAYPLWKLYRYERQTFGLGSHANNLNKKGMLITNEHSLAKTLLRLIVDEIENNPLLKDRLWTSNLGKESIIVKSGAEFQVKGSGSAIRGFHPTYIIVDDFLDDSVLYSQTQREKTINLFHSVIMNMIVPKGQVLVVGTPYHQSDLYANLKKSKGFRVFEYPAINPDGSLLWADRYNLQSLLDKKDSQGSIIFSREILCKPITSDSSIFPWSILETAFVGMDEFVLVENIYSFGRRFKKVVLGCDFAISSSIGADYTCFVTIGVDELDNYWILNIYREKGISYNQQIAKMKELNYNFKYNVIMCEDNAFQKVMLDLAKDAGLKVVPHTTSVNKYDLKTGLPGLSTLFEQSRIKLPRGDAHSKNMTDILCTEANGITWAEDKIRSTTDHDDSLYALWIAIKAANYVNSTFNYGFV